jgi:hypothetical protein
LNKKKGNKLMFPFPKPNIKNRGDEQTAPKIMKIPIEGDQTDRPRYCFVVN